MIILDDPTDYIMKDSDFAWIKNILEAIEYFTIWTTSKTTFILVENERIVGLLFYKESMWPAITEK